MYYFNFLSSPIIKNMNKIFDKFCLIEAKVEHCKCFLRFFWIDGRTWYFTFEIYWPLLISWSKKDPEVLLWHPFSKKDPFSLKSKLSRHHLFILQCVQGWKKKKSRQGFYFLSTSISFMKANSQSWLVMGSSA